MSKIGQKNPTIKTDESIDDKIQAGMATANSEKGQEAEMIMGNPPYEEQPQKEEQKPQKNSQGESESQPQPKQKLTRKTEEQDKTVEDKINAIFDMIPMIREAYNICQFMLENRGFNSAYRGYMSKDSEARKVQKINDVLDYYGVHHSKNKDLNSLTNIEYKNDKHVDVVCEFLALEGIPYDRSEFIVVKSK